MAEICLILERKTTNTKYLKFDEIAKNWTATKIQNEMQLADNFYKEIRKTQIDIIKYLKI